MFPDLSYLLHYLFGTPVDNWTSIFKTFGLFLVIAILGAAYLLYLELKRKAKEGLFQPERIKVIEGGPASWTEILSNAVFGFILGAKGFYIATHFPEFQADAAGVVLSTKGNFFVGVLGAILFGGGRYLQGQRNKKDKPIVKKVEVWPHDRIGDITVVAAISGLVGAKLFDVFEHLDDLMRAPLETLFSGGGLAIYGGLIVGFGVTYYYLKGKKINPVHVMDAAAPALIIGYGIGRMGCQFSGDGDWGIVNELAQPSWWFLPDWMWAYDYPHNVLNRGVPIEGCEGVYCSKLDPPVYPTPIYEIIMAFMIGGILWALRKRISIPGMLFFIYLIFNGLERFMIETIRVNIPYEFMGITLTQAQFIAIGLILAGIIGVIVLWQRARKKPQVDTQTSS